MEDHDIRAALDRHWAASDANDFEAEHQIYQENAVLEYPQSGERIRGRRNIQASRVAQPLDLTISLHDRDAVARRERPDEDASPNPRYLA